MLMKIRLPQVFLTLSTIHLYINKSGPTRPEGKFGPMTKRVTWTLKEHRASVPYQSVNTCKLNHSCGLLRSASVILAEKGFVR